MDVLSGVAVSALLSVFVISLCTVIEHVALIERYSLRARLPGLAMNLVQRPLTMLVAWPISQFLTSFPLGKLARIPLATWLAPLGAMALPLQVLILLMIADFLTYWRHRTEHTLFWRIHMVHHSPNELHAANDIGHPLQVLYSIAFISFPLSLVEIEGPSVPATASLIVTLLSYYIHSPTNLHFGPLRKVLVDNRFHRIHHSIEPRHFDKNFGICFSFWDHWFGTAYHPAPDEWPEVGLEGVAPPLTIRDYLLLPFRARADPSAIEATDADASACANCVTSSPRS